MREREEREAELEEDEVLYTYTREDSENQVHKAKSAKHKDRSKGSADRNLKDTRQSRRISGNRPSGSREGSRTSGSRTSSRAGSPPAVDRPTRSRSRASSTSTGEGDISRRTRSRTSSGSGSDRLPSPRGGDRSIRMAREKRREEHSGSDRRREERAPEGEKKVKRPVGRPRKKSNEERIVKSPERVLPRRKGSGSDTPVVSPREGIAVSLRRARSPENVVPGIDGGLTTRSGRSHRRSGSVSDEKSGTSLEPVPEVTDQRVPPIDGYAEETFVDGEMEVNQMNHLAKPSVDKVEKLHLEVEKEPVKKVRNIFDIVDIAKHVKEREKALANEGPVTVNQTREEVRNKFKLNSRNLFADLAKKLKKKTVSDKPLSSLDEEVDRSSSESTSVSSLPGATIKATVEETQEEEKHMEVDSESHIDINGQPEELESGISSNNPNEHPVLQTSESIVHAVSNDDGKKVITDAQTSESSVKAVSIDDIEEVTTDAQNEDGNVKVVSNDESKKVTDAQTSESGVKAVSKDDSKRVTTDIQIEDDNVTALPKDDSEEVMMDAQTSDSSAKAVSKDDSKRVTTDAQIEDDNVTALPKDDSKEVMMDAQTSDSSAKAVSNDASEVTMDAQTPESSVKAVSNNDSEEVGMDAQTSESSVKAVSNYVSEEVTMDAQTSESSVKAVSNDVSEEVMDAQTSESSAKALSSDVSDDGTIDAPYEDSSRPETRQSPDSRPPSLDHGSRSESQASFEEPPDLTYQQNFEFKPIERPNDSKLEAQAVGDEVRAVIDIIVSQVEHAGQPEALPEMPDEGVETDSKELPSAPEESDDITEKLQAPSDHDAVSEQELDQQPVSLAVVSVDENFETQNMAEKTENMETAATEENEPAISEPVSSDQTEMPVVVCEREQEQALENTEKGSSHEETLTETSEEKMEVSVDVPDGEEAQNLVKEMAPSNAGQDVTQKTGEVSQKSEAASNQYISCRA